MENIAKRVEMILLDSLFRNEEIPADHMPPENAVLVEAIVQKFGFHRGRLESHREEVKAILGEMPEKFHISTGGGWTFLNLCVDKDGVQWGEHRDIEALVALAMGLGMASYPMARDLWSGLPGGVPYVVFNTSGKNSNQSKGGESDG